MPVKRVTISGSRNLEADKLIVWRGLNDPGALQFCIQNCQSLEQLDEHNFRAKFGIRIGPLKIGVGADLVVTPVSPPDHYQLVCTVGTRILGQAEAVADVKLTGHDAGTEVSFSARIDLKGRLSSYDEDFISNAANRRLHLFFQSLQEWLNQGQLDLH
ncbi:MAG: carbon monoxide dehydrogenase subunit G [Parasphingorhabdus sp.]|jgi:carbon monoxide dehydrogenase subunit G